MERGCILLVFGGGHLPQADKIGFPFPISAPAHSLKKGCPLKPNLNPEQILHHFKNDPGILLAQAEGKEMGIDLVA